VEETANRPSPATISGKVNNTELQTCSSDPARRSATGCALGHVFQMSGAVVLAALNSLYRSLCTLLRKRLSHCAFCMTILLMAAIAGTTSAEDTPDFFDQLAPDTPLLRIVSADFGSGLYESSKSLATTFNWRHMPDQFASGETISRAIAVSTAGPLSSLEALMEGRAELAVVRADLADRIFTRNDDIRFAASNELRLVSTHIPVMLHIVVRDDFDGDSLSDLAGKRVNIGSDDTATMMNLSELLHQSGFVANNFEPYFAPVSDALRRLDTGSLDAVAFFDQAPSNLVSEAINTRKFRLLAINKDMVDGDSKGKFTPPSDQSHYFQTANTADFYSNGQNSPALVAATYLLTRPEVSSDTLNSVIGLLDIRPISRKQGGSPAAAKATDQARNPIAQSASESEPMDANLYQQPFKVADWISPIPLHNGAQVLIDIFTDPLILQDLPTSFPELDPAFIVNTGLSDVPTDPEAKSQ